MIRIDACKNGDKEALGELYTTYANRLLGVCRHYVKDDNSAHDILHDAFIIIFMSIQD
ncbi:sigma factor, partial [Segatella oris]